MPIKIVYGIDINQEQIDICRNIFNAEVRDLEHEKLAHESDFFDLVICNQVLEHIKDYRSVIDELIRVTRKDGYIVIGIPNLSHLINRIRLIFGYQPLCNDIYGRCYGGHICGFTYDSFVKMLNSIEEFELIGVTASMMYPFPFHVGNKLADVFPGLSSFTCYLLRKK